MVKVNAICFIKIIDTQKAAYGVENYEQATISLVMTSLRATVGKMDLDESLSSRDVIKAELVKAMSDQMTDWGLILRSIEIQDIAPSASMQVAMEQQQQQSFIVKQPKPRQQEINRLLFWKLKELGSP